MKSSSGGEFVPIGIVFGALRFIEVTCFLMSYIVVQLNYKMMIAVSQTNNYSTTTNSVELMVLH